MKNYIILLISTMLAMYQLNASPDKPTSDQGPCHVYISVNTANQAHLDQQNQFNQQANHASEQTTNVKTKVGSDDNISDFKKKLYDFYQEQSTNLHNGSKNVLAWINNNKIKTSALAIITLYSYLTFQIYRANQMINDSASWSNWHHGRTLEDLFATPQQSLETDLLFAIQTKYVHPVNPTDFIYSLVQSSMSLKKEIDIVKQQISRYEWINKCHCLPLFFIEQQNLQELQDRHKKLLFMQHLFACYCARYKIDKNN